MRTILACAIICFPLLLSGQNIPKISGTILDETSGEPVSYANVSLFETGKQQPVGGTFTDEDGTFTFQKIKEGTYDLMIRFVGI